MSGKRIMSVILILAVVVIIIWGGMIVWRLFFHETRRNVVLANDFQITSEWKEVGTQKELKVEKDYHYISLQIEPPLEAATTKWGIKVPGGEIVNPKISVIDVEGKEYPLVITGQAGGGPSEIIYYTCEGGLPINKTYQKVKLRSDFPITVKTIFWSGYDQSDLK
ncbi:MAG: hypothetical protein ACKVQW_03400 [Pyrinomonadaceae bacterium]